MPDAGFTTSDLYRSEPRVSRWCDGCQRSGLRGWPSTAPGRTLTLSYYEGKVISLLCLGVKLTQMLYVPRVGQRYSVFCGEANTSGPAYLCNLERPLPAGGEFVEPRSVQDPSEDEVASPELPTVHEPLTVAPERLVVACISDRCSPPSLVNEVHVVAPQLLLHGFVKGLDPW